jgi:hypothetical protein
MSAATLWDLELRPLNCEKNVEDLGLAEVVEEALVRAEREELVDKAEGVEVLDELDDDRP